MKNVHLLPTEKPSRLHFFTPKIQLSKEINSIIEGINIYITSDEKIKEGEYNVPSDFSKSSDISKTSKQDLEVVNVKSYGYKKIILTTDQDLIADGVQAISDDFLEWFIKNPTCEEVQVDKFISGRYFVTNPIIPQEDSKCTCSKGKGIDFDEMGLAYCVSCQKEIN